MHRICLLCVALLMLPATVWAPVPAAASPPPSLAPPLPGVPVRGFDDVGRYEAGHRGVDLPGQVGDPVVAAAGGTVSFAGSVAGAPTVSVDHGDGWRTTYQNVHASVATGETVRQGQPLGTLAAGHCRPAACLHWGLTDGVRYADPLAGSRVAEVRLLPRGTVPVIRPRPVAAAGGGRLPVDGRLTTGFGLRDHPITGERRLHDGVDLAAACGSPVTAPRPGVVTRTAWSRAYGWRVFLDHGDGLVTAYNHLPGLDVTVGQRLGKGQRVGRVGSTGLSTGCHLHWMAWRDGALVDPLTLPAP